VQLGFFSGFGMAKGGNKWNKTPLWQVRAMKQNEGLPLPEYRV
jgi:hypothetical protein